MIDVEKEQLLSLTEATRVVPALDGRRPHVSSIWRWCRKGVRGVKLEHLRVGRRVSTSKEALARFYENLANAPDPEPQRPASKSKKRTEKQKLRDVQEADQWLTKRGI